MSPDLLPGNGQGGSRWRRRRHVDALGTAGYRAAGYYESNPALRQALDAVAFGAFSNGDRAAFAALVDSLLYDDQYRVLADYQSYIDAQDRVEHSYRDPGLDAQRLLNVARSGFFSSDAPPRLQRPDLAHPHRPPPPDPIRPHLPDDRATANGRSPPQSIPPSRPGSADAERIRRRRRGTGWPCGTPQMPRRGVVGRSPGAGGRPGHQSEACAVRCLPKRLGRIGAVHHSHHVTAGQARCRVPRGQGRTRSSSVAAIT